jgi:6-pyruvoyltetrahydropterin/6-carboxytetrahydropterin synthase
MQICLTEIYTNARNKFIYCAITSACLYLLGFIDNNIISPTCIPCIMNTRIYKNAWFDASHRLLHYQGKCAQLHGHRWKVEVWVEGSVDQVTGILADYNMIREAIEQFDHQVILNEDDPMVTCLQQYQAVITTPGDPTSELLASLLLDKINTTCTITGLDARVVKIRVWESPTCFAEIAE